VSDQIHPESPRPPRYFHPDPSQADYSQGLPSELRALQRLLLPFPRVHERIRAAEVASHCQHHSHALLGNRDRIRARRIHYRDSLVRRGFQIDVVHAHAGAPDHPQFMSMRQQLGVRLYRRTHDQRIRGFQLLRKLSIQLVGRNHHPSWFL
jgi:hypothetical protein